ncbi:putative very-long-chain (3R)-3-hydroxyacyl-CoA dehydratase [Blattamonas nauphoetae]|uniref:very-long-chain (3R)-3-hydroxyacyl-CoA dehydratase n=1 Tax=Blattamonas nauphoetae TaxID=2049346 RepID=A0ABQ9YEN7_9EUKA|nr:putative very-long-chain (3R)-3-hydroxyacyl-CoA dehydratase [Blattamonas nauphoetae]
MPPLKQSPLVKNYLLLYNGIQLLVWTCGLISTFFSFLKWEISPANWKIPFVFFGIGHCVMILETVHALIGIVRSGWLANAIQVMSRLLVNSFFFWIGKDVIGWWTVMMAFSWGFAEVIRYLHNFTKVLMKTPPRIIGIIRYTAFIPLYPLGTLLGFYIRYWELLCLADLVCTYVPTEEEVLESIAILAQLHFRIIEEARDITKEILNQTFNSNTEFQTNRLDFWTASVVEGILKKLSTLKHQYKYAVTCSISQNIGAAAHSSCACLWDKSSDSYLTESFSNDTMHVHVTVFGFAL